MARRRASPIQVMFVLASRRPPQRQETTITTSACAHRTRFEEMPKRPRLKKRLPLSLERILDAALELGSAHGERGLEFRAIAERLECAQSSLYTYVEDRDDLRERVLDRVVGGVRLPIADPTRWPEQLYEVACELRRAILAHPAVATLMLHPAAQGPNNLRVAEGLASILQSVGVPSPIVPLAAAAIFQLTAAFAIQDACAQTRNDSDRSTLEARMKRALQRIDWPSDETEESMAARIDEILKPNASGFEFAVKTLVAGLRFQTPSALANESRQIREGQRAAIVGRLGQLDRPEEQRAWLIKVVGAIFKVYEGSLEVESRLYDESLRGLQNRLAETVDHLASARLRAMAERLAKVTQENGVLSAEVSRLRKEEVVWKNTTTIADFVNAKVFGKLGLDYWVELLRRVHKQLGVAEIARIFRVQEGVAANWIAARKVPKLRRKALDRAAFLLRIRLELAQGHDLKTLAREAENFFGRVKLKNDFSDDVTDD